MNRAAVRALALLAAVAVVAVLAGSSLSQDGAAAQGPTVRTGSITLAVGAQGDLVLDALKIAPPGLAAWTVDVTYDPAVLSVLSCSGAPFGICNGSFAPNATRATGISLGGLQGNVTLATLTVSCIANGASVLSITLPTFVDATPGGPQPIAAALDEGTVTCSASQPTPTPTNTTVPTATPTPTNTPDPAAAPTPAGTPAIDSDGDGCLDAQELGPNPLFGGQRDPQIFWDFFDPNRDRAISITDFFDLIARFGATDAGGAAPINRTTDPLSTPPPAPAYHTRFDRGGVVGANPWNLGPPDGAITVTDFFSLLAQFGHTCG